MTRLVVFPPIEPFAIPAICMAPVFRVRTHRFPIQRVLTMRTGSNHEQFLTKKVVALTCWVPLQARKLISSLVPSGFAYLDHHHECRTALSLFRDLDGQLMFRGQCSTNRRNVGSTPSLISTGSYRAFRSH